MIIGAQTSVGNTFAISVEFRNIGNPTFAGGTRYDLDVRWSDGPNPPLLETINRQIDGSHFMDLFVLDGQGAGAADDWLVSFSITVVDIDPASHWVFSMTSTSQSANVPMVLMGRSACSFRILDTPDINALDQTESERTTALTGLCSYMGSHLADGGTISSARLGMGLVPMNAPSGDVYGYLAQLPLYNDDYALKDGIYAWWLPDSVQEYFYTPYRAPRSDHVFETSLLCFAMHRDEPAQGVRLRVQQCIEVITRSRLYASLPAPVNPSYDVLVGAIKMLPAVTVNASHPGILAKALGAVKTFVSKPANWIKLLTGGANLIKKLIVT
jgi:hypothetical protein